MHETTPFSFSLPPILLLSSKGGYNWLFPCVFQQHKDLGHQLFQSKWTCIEIGQHPKQRFNYNSVFSRHSLFRLPNKTDHWKWKTSSFLQHWKCWHLFPFHLFRATTSRTTWKRLRTTIWSVLHWRNSRKSNWSTVCFEDTIGVMLLDCISYFFHIFRIV